MQILVHNANSSLIPNADLNPPTWTGPPQEIVIVQFILYISLASSFVAASLSMFGKQCLSRYARHRGGSAEEKSWDRQRKLDGFEVWYFKEVVERIPWILQLALLFLCCAMSISLWKICPTVSFLMMGFTIYGVIMYIGLQLLAWLCSSLPYQAPPAALSHAATKMYRPACEFASFSFPKITAGLRPTKAHSSLTFIPEYATS